MVRIAFAIFFLLVAYAAQAQQPANGLVNATQGQNVLANGGGTSNTLANQVNHTIWAPNFGTCTWTSGGDVGPCINAALSYADSLGGRIVLLPGGTYGVATMIYHSFRGTTLLGMGVGNPRDNAVSGSFQGGTTLKWNGSATPIEMYVGPGVGATETLYSAGVDGIIFDGNDLVDFPFELASASNSLIRVGATGGRKANAWVTTAIASSPGGVLITDSPGTQSLDLWIDSRDTSSSYSPTGILIDGGQGSNFNVSYNRIRHLYAWYNNGDGIVLGNADNNLIDDLRTFHQPSGTGSSTLFPVSGYTMPSGISTNTTHGAYIHRVLHTGSPVQVQGYTPGTTFVASGGNTGTAALATSSITTNATTNSGNGTLNYSSVPNTVLAGMNINCTGGQQSGVFNNSTVLSTTATTVVMLHPAVGGVSASQACTFGFGVTQTAVTGIYTLTATSATTFNLTAPAGGTSQSGISLSAGGVLTFTDMVIPLTGTAVATDNWLITTPTPDFGLSFEFIDKGNAIPDAYFGPGSTGSQSASDNPYPKMTNGPGINIPFGIDNCGLTPNAAFLGQWSVNIGQCGASGPQGKYSVSVGGTGTQATGFGAVTVAGNNLKANGTYAVAAGGDTNTLTGAYSTMTGGLQGCDRGDTAQVWANGKFSAQCDNERRSALFWASIASTSSTRLTVNGVTTASASNGLRIGTNTAIHVIVDAAVCTDTTARANWASWNRFDGVLSRAASTASYAGGASTATTPSQSGGTMSTATLTIAADTTNEVLSLAVVMPNTNATHCTADVRLLEAQ